MILLNMVLEGVFEVLLNMTLEVILEVILAVLCKACLYGLETS